MKKILGLILVSISYINCYAQGFTLTPDGWKNSNDASLDYIVIPLDGTQSELFNDCKNALTVLYRSSKTVVSENFPSVINIGGVMKLYEKHLLVTDTYNCYYNLILSFKDNKMRIDITAHDALHTSGCATLYLYKGSSSFFSENPYVFNMKGKLKKKKIKEQAEKYFNELINNLIEMMKNKSTTLNNNN